MTITEIANVAGVSISTVSKIVNNKAENINIETRNRVLKIVKEYNYTPYGAAKSLSNAKTFLIGVLLKHSSPFKCQNIPDRRITETFFSNESFGKRHYGSGPAPWV